MEEIWKDIEGYEGIYQVSNLGNVKSLDRMIVSKNGITKKLSGKLLSPGKDNYLFVTLCVNGVSRNHQVHRLVAQAFLPNVDNLPEVNHKDSNTYNNEVSNLEWVTSKDNQLHVLHSGRKSQAIKVKCVETGKVYDSMRQAELDYGFYLGVVSDCIKHNKSYEGVSFQLA